MWISNIVVMAISWYFFLKTNQNLANKFLQIEIIKKANTFEEAKNFWMKDIAAEQHFDKIITDKHEKAFVKEKKEKLTPEQKEEMDWVNEDDKD